MKKQTQHSKRLKCPNWLVPVLIVSFFLYVGYTVVTQGIKLNNGNIQLSNLNAQIEDAQRENAELLKEQEMATTLEYREDVARRRDGLVFPNEIIFVDALAN